MNRRFICLTSINGNFINSNEERHRTRPRAQNENRTRVFPLPRECFTTKLSGQKKCWERDSNPRRRIPPDLQSGPFDHFGIPAEPFYFTKNSFSFPEKVKFFIPSYLSNICNFSQFPDSDL